MKHSYLILIALFTFSFVQAQIVDIPDANFKNALVNTNCVDADGNGTYESDADINNDGEIQVSEAESVLRLYIRDINTSSLEGIQSFINLTYLNCSYNQLTTLDVNALTNLGGLSCSENQLTTLDVSSMTNLVSLGCGYNQLTTLDVSGLTNLRVVSCPVNQLTTLNLSGGLTSLIELNCYDNQLTTLDVSEFTNLTNLGCGYNQLTTLDVSTLTNLRFLNYNGNQIEILDFSMLTRLRELSLANNQLTTLDVSDLINLEVLHCGYNQLTTLDVSELRYLEDLFCASNQLVAIFMKNGHRTSFSDVFFLGGNPNLEYICVDDYELVHVLSVVEELGYSNCVVNSYCTFTPGGEFYTIEGQNTLDFNTNGCDANDINFPNLKFNITNGTANGTIVSNTTGNYTIPVQAGVHTITPMFENSNYFTAFPTNVVVDFPTEASPNIQDFCITPNGTHNDLEIVILPLENARPGFDTDYKLIYKNKGNTVLNGSVNLMFQDEVMDLVTANPSVDNQVVNELTWNYTDLLPFETYEVLITMGLNTPTDTPPLNGGDTLVFEATINPVSGDETADDNTHVLNQTVFNAIDPNDKTCLQGETITLEQVGKFVHYMIRFENTGTASAVNIVVKDEIDMSKYDVSSLIPLNASHDFITRIKDDNIVEFIFEDIYLPFDDANNDGYVVFKIKTLDTLELGDDFSNQAEIYFDYNFPIITNDELTTVAENLSVEESELQTIVKIYPNPVNDYLFIESKNTIKSITIYAVNGRLLQNLALTGSNTNTKINISSLSKGLYFVSIKTDVGEQTTKIIKE